jgi:hypothetical protein
MVVSMATPAAANSKRKFKVLALDGAKVYDFLFHVAIAQVWLQDLMANPKNLPTAAAQALRARGIASILYASFLQAAHQGPQKAVAFLTRQHELQRHYLLQAQPILQAQQLAAARNVAFLSEWSFGTQVVKSTAISTVAVGALFVDGVAVSALGLTLDVSLEIVGAFGSKTETQPNTVVVGFKQTMLNDTVGLLGSVDQMILQGKGQALAQTLSSPMKSSIYRTDMATADRIDSLSGALGVLSAVVTVYSEFEDSAASYKQMTAAQNEVTQLTNQTSQRTR